MAAAIKFLSGISLDQDLGTLGMGLGFYGPGSFGSSSRVGVYAQNCYATDSTGAVEGPKANCISYVDSTHGQLGTGDTHLLVAIPNNQSVLNVRFTNDSAVQVQNVTCTVFDRSNINAAPTGVLTKVAELVHPGVTLDDSVPTGSGSTSWFTPGGSGGLMNGYTWDVPVSLTNSPGPSGLHAASGITTAQTQHDWYLAVSQTATSIGSKLSAMLISLEYL